MQRYFIYLAYDGTHYHGWQVQPNGISVQEVVQKALSTLLRQETKIVGAGRTDTGVNASCMVAHFDAEPLDTCWLTDKMNRLLPPDVAVNKVVPVTAEAHARFDATARTYHYFVYTGKCPFKRHYAARLFYPLDFDKMNEAAQELLRYTDFTSFSKTHTDVKTNNCDVMRALWTPMDDGCWRFEIKADRFLRNMVRAVVGTLVEVGRGRLSKDDFCRVIEQKNRCCAGESMPGNALFLVDVDYPSQLFVPSEDLKNDVID